MKRFKLYDSKKEYLGEFDTFIEAWQDGTDYKATTGNTYFIQDTGRHYAEVISKLKGEDNVKTV
jgi:hypothetical protein